jgi:hypothetical protein
MKTEKTKLEVAIPLETMKFKNVTTQGNAVCNRGYDMAILNDKKYYRAWGMAGKERLESEIYEACDDADMPDLSRADLEEVRFYVARSEKARASMTDKQRSPQDMLKIAESLMTEASETNLRRKKEDDERFHHSQKIRIAMNVLEPLVYITKYGTDEQKATLKHIVQQLKEL